MPHWIALSPGYELAALFVSLFFVGVWVECFLVDCLVLVFVLGWSDIGVVPCISPGGRINHGYSTAIYICMYMVVLKSQCVYIVYLVNVVFNG